MEMVHSHLKTFRRFPHLPHEIQSSIWKLSVPDPSDVQSVIVIIINHDLSQPKGFIPSQKQLADYHEEYAMQDRHLREMLDYRHVDYIDFGTRRPILHIMHACRTSRRVMRRTYSLALESILQEENQTLWRNDDIVYFQCTEDSDHIDSMLQYLTTKRACPLNGFETIKHVTFRLSTAFVKALGWHDDWTVSEEDYPIKHNFLGNLPNIDSLSLFTDPSNLHEDWRTGKIALYSPDPVIQLASTGQTAAQIEAKIKELLARTSGREASALPIVDIFVMLRRRAKERRGL